MGKKLLAVFDQDLKVGVRDPLMSEIAKAILKECDDLNATEAASSSGKYHPIADLGKEGLEAVNAKWNEFMYNGFPGEEDDE